MVSALSLNISSFYLDNVKNASGSVIQLSTASGSPADPVDFTSQLISLLQGRTEGGDLLANLLGAGASKDTADPLADLYTALSPVDTKQNVENGLAALEKKQNAASAQSAVQALLSSTGAASNAYNQTLLRNAQSVLDAGKPIIA